METSEQVTYNQADINVKKIEEEINKLKKTLTDSPVRKNYREFWEQSHYVINLFKLLKPILPEDKDRLWKEFAELREQTKQQEISDREVRRKESSEKRQVIEAQLADIENQLLSVQDYSELEKVKEILQNTLNMLKGTSQVASVENTSTENASVENASVEDSSEETSADLQENTQTETASETAAAETVVAETTAVETAVAETAQVETAQVETAVAETVVDESLVREDKEACWVIWRKVNESVKQKRQDLEEKVFSGVKLTILDILKAAEEGNPHDALKRIKEIQSDPKTYKFNKAFREEIKGLLNQAFDSAIKRIKEVREENKRRHQEWISRMESNVARWNELHEKNISIISGLEAQITKLEEDVNNAKTPEFAERIRTWIDEKSNKIKDIKETNAKLEEKISSVQKSLGKIDHE
ncbi:MAG: hypothetical protein Q8940_15890 [Bacteroidota bacterium]|nr:hypothetical protein [Bacteroidota bacterium]